MDDKKEIIQVTTETKDEKDPKEIKQVKQEKNVTKLNKNAERENIIAYAQVAFHTLQHSATEITPRAIREEITMFYNKFGNDGVKKIANTIIKEKKEKK